MIFFAIGKDRPGIVDEITSYLFERDANIEDSRMAVLGGRFSIMSLISCSSESMGKISDDIDSLKDNGLEASLYEADSPESLKAEAHLPLSFEVISMDHPGIVQRVVHILRGYNISIHSLNTELKPMPHSGAPLFDLVIEADVPGNQSIAVVKNRLTDLAFEMNLDLTFRT